MMYFGRRAIKENFNKALKLHSTVKIISCLGVKLELIADMPSVLRLVFVDFIVNMYIQIRTI